MKGDLLTLREFYELDKGDTESPFKFVNRNIDAGVFKLRERAMLYHFKRGTGFVFIPSDGAAFFISDGGK